ncbi:hypothetical protein [Catellatospora vulcania]|uniref:hypothetical protein n=1 Tax=Catellatospora vulcania TaxID=1460450 RepID=UPI0012D42DF1|nr:hypothetical protein [Catellatospora vulcania]
MSERELIEGLARLAGPVVPGEDPYGRLMRRHRRGRRRMLAGGISAVLAAALAGIMLGPLGPATTAQPEVVDPSASPVGVMHRSEPITPWIRRLIESPTRGSLAADRGFVDELAARLRQRDVDVVPDGAVKILFVGDVGTARLVVAARYDAGQQVGIAVFDERGASPEQLANAGTEQRANGSMVSVYPLNPYVGVSFANTAVAWGAGVDLALVPAGCRIAVATISTPRTWRDEPTGDLVLDVQPTQVHRVTCDGKVRYLGRAGAGGLSEHNVRPLTEEEVTAAVAAARGEVDPVKAAALLRRQGSTSGLIGPPRLLYMGRLPDAPADEPAISLIVAPEADGIWRVEVETQQAAFGFHTDVDLGRAGAMIAMESWWLTPPSSTPNPTPNPTLSQTPNPTRVLVLAPPEAVEVRLLAADDRVTGTFELVDGVGAFPYDGKSRLRLQAVDAAGAVVGTGNAPFSSYDASLEQESIYWE